MDRCRWAAVALAAALCLARGAAADVHSLDFVLAPFRGGDFARLEAILADLARSHERTDNGWSALSRS